MAETRQDVEARQMQLPSVTAERLAEIEREAFAEGRARGQKAAEAEATLQLEATTAAIATTVKEISALRRGIMQRTERDVVRLAIAMAERIVRRQVEVDPDALLVIARVAIDRLGERTEATVHLHPADFAILSRLTAHDGSTITLVSDASVSRGGCLITSALGEIDAGIDAQVHELARELLGVDAGEDHSNVIAANF